MQKITPCLWFDDQAEEAVAIYTAIFKSSKILEIARYPESGHEFHGKRAGSVMTITFELNGQTFTALNGGPVFTFNEAISFQVSCENQREMDEYWQKLSEGGDEKAQPIPCFAGFSERDRYFREIIGPALAAFGFFEICPD